MINNYLKNISCILLVCVGLNAKAQLPFSETFGGACNVTFPGGWAPSGGGSGDWIIDGSLSCPGGVPTCTIGGSSGNSVMAGQNVSGAVETVTYSSINTIGFSGITVKWNGYRTQTPAAPTLTLEWSQNGTVWNAVGFTDVIADDNWHAVTTVTLPAGADNQLTLHLRWSYTSDASSSFLAVDDILVQGNTAATYYWNGVGALDVFASWGVNTNGSGTPPTSFFLNNQTFNMVNGTAATLTGNWTIGGSGSNLIVGDGGVLWNVNFTIPSTFAITLNSPVKMTITNSSSLTIQNTTFPPLTAVTLNAGSTVDYAQSGNVNIWQTSHTNLTISGGSDKTHVGGAVTVTGILNLNGSSLVMSNSALANLTLSGTITGAGTLKTSTNSRLQISGSGAFGTITFGTGGTNKTLSQFNVNRGTAGSVVLGSDLTSASTSNLQNGTIDISGKILTLNGVLTLPATTANGSFVGSKTSTLSIGGSGAISGNLLMSAPTMGYVLLNRAGQILTAGNAIEIWGDVTPTAGTFASGSNLTLKSDASNKGRIGVIGGTGFFTGTPVVELYKSGGLTGWTNICASGVTGNSISGWNSSFAITCTSGCPNGSSVGGVPFSSAYTYDESTFNGDDADPSHYIEITGTGQTLDSKKGYWIYLGNGFPNTSTIMIPLTGGVNTKNSSGAITVTSTFGASATNGWNLIANPYPSPISVTNLLNAIGASSLSIDNTFYAYDPDASTNTPLTAGSIIPMGQAFSVRSLVGSVGLTPDETWKTTSNNNAEIFKVASSSTYYWNDFLLNLTSTSFTTNFVAQSYFMFGSGYSATSFDNGKDAYYLRNAVEIGIPEMFSTTNGENFLRNALPSISGLVTIPLTVRTGTAFAGVYQISPVNLNKLPAGACVSLYDIANNITHNLKTGAYNATITANATAPQFELRITLNPATMTSSLNNPLCSKMANGSIIAKGTSAGPWNYTWKDASDNIVKTKNNSIGADTLTNLGGGATYKVDINTASTCDNASQTFNVVSSAVLPVSNFIVNKDTIYLGSSTQFIFSNTSTGANTFNWTFGDGNGSTLQNPTHMYSSVGDYNVKLIAINSACGDSSDYSYVVHTANTPTLAGIASLAASDSNIKIGKDGKGIFVQMNYDKNTQATVSISNVLGQILVSPRIIEGDTEKFYFDVNAKDQLLLITVTTNDKRITQRIFNN